MRPPVKAAGEKLTSLEILEAAQNATRVAAAFHSYERTKVSWTCDGEICDQQDWLRNWSAVTVRYNSPGAPYKLDANSVNSLVRDGTRNCEPNAKP